MSPPETHHAELVVDLHAASVTDKTVAVLPFHNGGLPEDAYLADGLTDDLIDVLSMTRGLKVRPRGVVAHLQGQELDPRQVGRDLAVQVVVQGSVRKTPAGVRANARLIGVADGFQLWAKRFDRPAKDAFLINDEAGQAIAEALTVHFTAKPRAAPTDPEAVDLYLRASHELAKFWLADVERAVDLFEQALARAPNDPTILAGCARARVRLAFFGGDRSKTLLALAVEAADRAVAGAPENGESWAALAGARFMGGDAAGAVRALRTAITRAPGLAHAQELFGRILLEIGEVDEARSRLRTALSIDPTVPSARWELARMHALLGEWKESDARMDPPVEGPTGHISKFLHRLRFAVWRGQYHPDLEYPPALGAGFGVFGQRADLGKFLREHEVPEWYLEALDATARAEQAGRRRVLFFQLNAEIHAYSFEVDGSLAAIHEAVDAGLLDLLWIERCPVLEAVRKDARFPPLHAEVLARARRVQAALEEA
jgi:serine/threonine-protein kinase